MLSHYGAIYFATLSCAVAAMFSTGRSLCAGPLDQWVVRSPKRGTFIGVYDSGHILQSGLILPVLRSVGKPGGTNPFVMELIGGLEHQSKVLEASQDLRSWTRLHAIEPDTVRVEDWESSVDSHRFYRVVSP